MSQAADKEALDALRALQALYLEAPAPVCDDIRRRVNDVLDAKDRFIRRQDAMLKRHFEFANNAKALMRPIAVFVEQCDGRMERSDTPTPEDGKL